jgi:hypothetical protein
MPGACLAAPRSRKRRCAPSAPRSVDSPNVPQKLLTAMRAQAEGAGLNLFGLVDRARFDACEPKERRIGAVAAQCGVVIVLGSGGRLLAEQSERLRDSGRGTLPSAAEHAENVVARLVAMMRGLGLGVRALTFDGACRVRAERLAEAAGLGVVSPVSGLLLHPEFGPWLRIRGAICCDGMPFGPIPDANLAERFQPCVECARPCVPACPAHDGDAAKVADRARCADHRNRGGCADACSSRVACPLGAEHADHAGEHLHSHGVDLETLRRWQGLGPWSLVPKALRGGP